MNRARDLAWAAGLYGVALETGTHAAGAGTVVSPLPGEMTDNLVLVWIPSQT